MSTYVHLHVAFNCPDDRRNTDPEATLAALAALAKRHLPAMEHVAERQHNPYPVWFLQALSDGKCHNEGPKGCLILWGTIGSNVIAETDFVVPLIPFWRELFWRQPGDLILAPWSHIVVFEEHEESAKAFAIEIYSSDPEAEQDPEQWELVIKKHETLPFAWMQ